MQTLGILRPRGGGWAAANALKVMVFHWFYNVSATVPMTLPMGEGPAGRQLGLDADVGNARNALFYNVFEAFRVNCRKMQTMELFSIVVPFSKLHVLQRFLEVPSLGSGPDFHRLHLMAKGLEL